MTLEDKESSAYFLKKERFTNVLSPNLPQLKKLLKGRHLGRVLVRHFKSQAGIGL